jgi:hypothetical protein
MGGVAAAAVILVAAVRYVFLFLFCEGVNKWSFSHDLRGPLRGNDSCFVSFWHERPHL